MNIMTALKETELLWKELERTGEDDKILAIEKVGHHIFGYSNTCPCCEFSDHLDCRDCPIWTKEKPCNYTSTGEYSLWLNSTTIEDRQKYAGQIADMAQDNYDLLKALGYSEDD